MTADGVESIGHSRAPRGGSLERSIGVPGLIRRGKRFEKNITEITTNAQKATRAFVCSLNHGRAGEGTTYNHET